ncbi:sulfurtransferase [Aestuariibacter sp. A3R04]|uniref:sulfurtransferase n=1 Tax=Aestuariibacter sp. A3R04 TaxID=2841571 RepID=UPI001C0939AE|nr:sulfurtransferase [Aestuariibacter sp. A3R04]MBU3022836.1 sulfurtransferase [Aestuariibacter sp. A3R04]
MSHILISAEQLQEKLVNQQVVLLRALMADPVNGTADTVSTGIIPGAVDVDIDGEGSDHKSAHPHTMLAPEAFATILGNKGVTAESEIVIYDNRGQFSAARLWWMLKSVGHCHVRLLDGGWPAWNVRFPSMPKSQPNSPSKAFYQVENDIVHWFVGATDVLQMLGTDVQIVDVRSAERFHGRVEEPRAGLRRGHIPGAYNLPFAKVLEGGFFKSPDALHALFTSIGVSLDKPLIFSCGSGVTACIVGVAARLCGADDVKIYDGAWSEWGASTTLPIEV